MTTPLKLKYEESVNLCNQGDFELALRGFEKTFSLIPQSLGDQAIRRTYVLSSWILLGKFSFPPALASISVILAEKQNRISQGDSDADLVKDVEAIKFCLNNLNCTI